MIYESAIDHTDNPGVVELKSNNYLILGCYSISAGTCRKLSDDDAAFPCGFSMRQGDFYNPPT